MNKRARQRLIGVTILIVVAITALIFLTRLGGGTATPVSIDEALSDPSLVGKQVAQTALSTTWQQISVGYTAVSTGSSSLDLQAWIDGAPVGTCFAADDVAIAAA